MIQANELRIGNMVTDEWSSSRFVVDSINLKGIDLEIQDDGRWAEIAQSWIEPNYKFEELRGITLTEDWLLKFGFQLTHYPGEGTCAESNGLQVWYQYGFAQFGSTKRIECKYVHQLQNLFFCLFQKELTYA